MFGIRYLKVPPTTYVLHYKAGQMKREGAGLSFFYFGPTSEIVLVPLESTDVPFLRDPHSPRSPGMVCQGPGGQEP